MKADSARELLSSGEDAGDDESCSICDNGKDITYPVELHVDTDSFKSTPGPHGNTAAAYPLLLASWDLKSWDIVNRPGKMMEITTSQSTYGLCSSSTDAGASTGTPTVAPTASPTQTLVVAAGSPSSTNATCPADPSTGEFPSCGQVYQPCGTSRLYLRRSSAARLGNS